MFVCVWKRRWDSIDISTNFKFQDPEKMIPLLNDSQLMHTFMHWIITKLCIFFLYPIRDWGFQRIIEGKILEEVKDWAKELEYGTQWDA